MEQYKNSQEDHVEKMMERMKKYHNVKNYQSKSEKRIEELLEEVEKVSEENESNIELYKTSQEGDDEVISALKKKHRDMKEESTRAAKKLKN